MWSTYDMLAWWTCHLSFHTPWCGGCHFLLWHQLQQDTVNLTKEMNPFYPMPDLKFLLLDGHIRPFLCLPHYLYCRCLTTFFTSHHCVPRHNLCGASAGRAPLNLTWRVVPWLSKLGGGHKCTIVSVFTEVLIILHRSSEIYQHRGRCYNCLKTSVCGKNFAKICSTKS